MKSLPVVVSLLLALSLPACQKRAASPGEATYPRDVAGQTTGLGNGDATPVRIDASAVWSGSTDACRQAATPAGSHCVVDALRSAGATPAAIAAAQRLAAQGESGYVSAWDDQSGVGVATLEFPLRANTNQGTWLVDANGRTIDVDADVLPDSARTEAQASAFFDRHPEAVPFAPAQARRHRAVARRRRAPAVRHAAARLPCVRRRRHAHAGLRLRRPAPLHRQAGGGGALSHDASAVGRRKASRTTPPAASVSQR
ncbi:MAG: hypothetical protein ACWGG5_04805 [Stenotrophomonas sp.]